MHNEETHEVGTNVEAMSADKVLALGESVLKQAFYETPTDIDDYLLTIAFQLRKIASDKGAIDK